MLTRDATLIWNSLRGLICVYKPAERKVTQVRRIIINQICNELNELDVRPPIDHVNLLGNPATELKVVVQPNLADDPKVVGPRYQSKDVLCSWANFLGTNTSGVLLLGIRNGRITKYIRDNKSTRAYRIKGTFGTATDNCFKDGKVIEKTTYKHVKHYHMEKLLSYMQAAHQKKMFELCGVDIQSQAAYELASQGLIRPANSKLPVLYGIKCIEFNIPDFTLEVQCINEYEKYLQTLIHEIGLKLHASAHCTAIQCIRHSYFTLDDALLKKHWTLQYIINNMNECNKILEEHKNILKSENVALQN